MRLPGALNLSRLTVLAVIAVLAAGCGRDVPISPIRGYTGPPPPIQQGIAGRVEYVRHNFDPFVNNPGGEDISDTVIYVSRQVCIFNRIVSDSLSPNWPMGPGFYLDVPYRLVASTTSDTLGYFQIEVNPGSYSLFVKELGHYYANTLSYDGYIQPVTVEHNKVSRVRVIIDHAGVW